MLKLKSIPTVNQIIRIIEEIAPRSLALPGDPVGLQCGESGQSAGRMMISLDASLETVHQAVKFGAGLLVTHHPLLFEPLTPKNISGAAGRTLARAIREGLAVYSAHTNLDVTPSGINATLAGLLELRDVRFLQESGPETFKFVVFVPTESLERVQQAAFRAGAGMIGDYSRCSFAVQGAGTFRPEEGASPATGQTGRDQEVREWRLEIPVPAEALGAVLDVVRKVHPYEEPAIDIYPTVANPVHAGLGITGLLPQPSTVGQLAARISSALKAGSVRLVGKSDRKVKTVAVCAGSGGSLIDAAVAARAQLYITGDVKYHDARKAEDAGIQVLDVGHFAPERYGLGHFGKLLEEKLADRGFNVEIKFAKEKDPFVPVS